MKRADHLRDRLRTAGDHLPTTRRRMHKPDDGRPPWAQRMTSLGPSLGRTRIASLPQLANVLRDEMSLIDRDAASPSFLE
jgi:lipopolysaccharide/colanic/teichoic acid biosynthesis glycosyltransferase